MFRKKVEYEDEKQPMPIIWTIVIAIAVVGVLFFGTLKFSDFVEKREMRIQYGNDIEIVH